MDETKSEILYLWLYLGPHKRNEKDNVSEEPKCNKKYYISALHKLYISDYISGHPKCNQKCYISD